MNLFYCYVLFKLSDLTFPHLGVVFYVFFFYPATEMFEWNEVNVIL